MKITVTFESGNGGLRSRRLVIERSRELSEGNPAFYAKELRSNANTLTEEIAQQLTAMYGDAEAEPNPRNWPTIWRLG